MSSTLFDDLKNLLAGDSRFSNQDGLLKNRVTELALKADEALIERLLPHPEMKRRFFTEVAGALIFEAQTFIRVVNSTAFLPKSFTAFRNKIGLTDNNKFLSEQREIVLAWPYKDCVLQGAQTSEKRRQHEIFWNETLAPEEIDQLFAPKVLTDFRRVDAHGGHPAVELLPSDSLLIKGNNLLALHSLKPRFAGQIKLIYIDPPYNTGDDSFGYNDRFSHATWLTYMKNRLEIASELLRDDGFIFIQIDNRELAYLKVLCDEIFGRDNFRNAIITKKGQKNLQKQFKTIDRLNAGYDTLLFYSKSDVKIPNLFKQLRGKKAGTWNNHWRGTNRPTMRFELFGITPQTGQWRWSKTRTYRAVENYKTLQAYMARRGISAGAGDGTAIDAHYQAYLREHGIADFSAFELVRLSKTGKPEHYIPPSSTVLLSENWMDINVAGHKTSFAHEKNEAILERILNWLTVEGDWVLDFFAGSGTTAAVAHKLHRRFITIEQMDYIESLTLARLKNVVAQAGGSFVYAALMPWNQVFADAILAADSPEALQKIWQDMQQRAFLEPVADTLTTPDFAAELAHQPLDEQKRALFHLLDKNQLYVNLSEMADADFNISDTDRALNRQLYNPNE